VRRIRRLVVVLIGTASIAAGAPGTSFSAQPGTLRIESHGVFTGPASAAGTFTLSGLVSDSGSYTESFRFAGSTIHVEKTLTGHGGTITLAAQGVVVWTSPTTATFAAGHWQVVSGTGDYANLRAGGSPGAVGSADLGAGTADVVHDGSGQLG